MASIAAGASVLVGPGPVSSVVEVGRDRGARGAPRSGRSSPPALTGGESPKTDALGAKVDWLTVTWYPDPDEHVPALVLDFLGKFCGQVQGVESDGGGMFGYTRGVRWFVDVGGAGHHVARLDFGGNHHRGRARLDLSGSACALIADWPGVRAWVGGLFDYKLTRVDLAVDCLMGEFSVEDARDWYLGGEFNAGGRNPRHSLVGDWLAPVHGRTLEVGRRENGKMLRAYEKGRQLGDRASPWTRFEVELRNRDRELPLDLLTACDEYFVGAYRCLERLLDAAGSRIATHQREGEISIAQLIEFARTSYGQLVHVLRGRLSAGDVLTELSRPGVPRRLEKACLAGFNVAAYPAAFLRSAGHEDECARVRT